MILSTIAANIASLPSRAKIAIGIALAIALVLSLAYCSGRREGKAGADLAIERANTKAVAVDSRAREQAADERLADAKANLEAKKELSDVVNSLPDTLPSAQRVALGCLRLQRSGQDTAAIPACAGHQRGH